MRRVATQPTVSPEDLAELLADAPPEVWKRTVRAVAAMHEPVYRHDTCRYCRPGRSLWWRVIRRRRPAHDCQTRRVIVAELRTGARQHWASA